MANDIHATVKRLIRDFLVWSAVLVPGTLLVSFLRQDRLFRSSLRDHVLMICLIELPVCLFAALIGLLFRNRLPLPK